MVHRTRSDTASPSTGQSAGGRSGERWAAIGILAGYLFQYYIFVVGPNAPQRRYLDDYGVIAGGHAPAPDQYRLLVPFIVTRIARLDVISLAAVVIAVQAICLGAAFAAVLWLRRETGAVATPEIVVSLVIAFFGIAALITPQPETFLALAAATAATVAFLRPGHRIAFLAAGAVLALTRPELPVLLGAVYLLRAVRDRRAADVARAAYLVACSGAVLVAVNHAWHPRYLPTVGLIQLTRNVKWVAMPLFILAPFLPGLLHRVRSTSVAGERSRDDVTVLLAWPAAASVLFYVIAKVDEAGKLWMPFVGLLIVATDHWWSERRSLSGPDEAKVSTST